MIPNERCYVLSLEEILIWDKLLESAKAINLGDSKPPPQPTNNSNFCNIIKDSSHQFDFCDTNNNLSNVDLTGKENYTDYSGNYSTILTKLSKREKVYPVDI